MIADRFPSALSPLCAIPTTDDRASYVVCAVDTIRSACNLLDSLAHALEDSEAPEATAHWTVLNTAQWAIIHALRLLEDSREKSGNEVSMDLTEAEARDLKRIAEQWEVPVEIAAERLVSDGLKARFKSA